MLKGQVFSRQLFENQIFALFIDTFLNGNNGVASNYANEMALSYSGSDVTIDSGAVCIQGRFLNEDTSTTLSAGTDAMYCKLVIEIDLDKQNTESDFQQGAYKIITSASGYPNLTQTNIVKNNAGVYQYELARFKTSANGISDFQDKRTFLDFESIYDEIRQHIQDIDNGSLYVQKAGDTMTGALTIQKETIDTFIHERTIDNAKYKTKVGTGRSFNQGEASLLLTDENNNILGRLDVKADGKIYNGMTNKQLVEGKISVLEATFTLTAGSREDAIFNYPEGFTKDNCVVIAKAYSQNNGLDWTYDISSNFFDFFLFLRSNGINYICTNNADVTYTFKIKVVLMKV